MLLFEQIMWVSDQNWFFSDTTVRQEILTKEKFDEFEEFW